MPEMFYANGRAQEWRDEKQGRVVAYAERISEAPLTADQREYLDWLTVRAFVSFDHHK